MNKRFLHVAGALLVLGMSAIFEVEPLSAQTVVTDVCPRDSTGGRVNDGNGVFRTGTMARQYVVSFLSTDPASISRTSTGTGGVDTTMIRQLTDRTDKPACGRINAFMNSGVSQSRTSPPWVYFRAGNYYFIARWTPAQPRSNYTLQHEAVIVLDANFNLVGVWTA